MCPEAPRLCTPETPKPGKRWIGSLGTPGLQAAGSRAPWDQHPFGPPSPGIQGRSGNRAAGAGGGDSAASGEGGSAWGGGAQEHRLRPPPPPEGTGRRWPARSKREAAASAVGAAGRGPAAPGGTERVGAGWPPARSRVWPLLSRLPPPRAELSIHKFSACSAATGRRSPPGAPCSSPPAAHGPRAPALR